MITVKDIIIQELDNAGCNNGQYPKVHVTTSEGFIRGYTCRCGKGCSGTWNINRIAIGDTFPSTAQLLTCLKDK